MRLSNATTHFTRQLAANGCCLHTQKAYVPDLRALARWLGQDAALSAIKPSDLARHLISDAVLRTSDGSPRKAITINRTKSVCRGGRSFFAFCVESGWIMENPGPADPVVACSANGPVTAAGSNARSQPVCPLSSGQQDDYPEGS